MKINIQIKSHKNKKVNNENKSKIKIIENEKHR